MTQTLDLSYPSVLKLIEKHLVPGRTESHAFLLWFLENYYRLEEVDAQDCVCDGLDDRGVDGLYVDDNLERIDVLQCKLLQNNSRTLGDGTLKEFIGTLAQFRDAGAVKSLAELTTNTELAGLLRTQQVADKIGKGYSVRGVFLTNTVRDQNTTQYLLSQSSSRIALYDKVELQNSYIHLESTGLMVSPITFNVASGFIDWNTAQSKVIITPVLASDLVRMEGISDQTLFAWNVRQSLGRTKVNKDIEESIHNLSEHENFMLYHNGLTILCESLEANDRGITISGYSVVNGCQSLTSLYKNRNNLSDKLRILTRIIQVPPDGILAARITSRTNTQNGITARDLQSNSTIQTRLQREISHHYPGIFYRIKRGETSPAQMVIENELAARILLAFDLKEPWNCHLIYKLFDESHAKIFGRPEVNAYRIVALHDMYELVLKNLTKIDDQPFGTYGLTKFFLLYLIRQALEKDEEGRKFCQSPDTFVTADRGRQRLSYCINKVLDDLIVELNSEIEERTKAGNPFDYKRELKTPNPVRSLEHNIIPQYEKLIRRKRIQSFGDDWKSSAELDAASLQVDA